MPSGCWPTSRADHQYSGNGSGPPATGTAAKGLGSPQGPREASTDVRLSQVSENHEFVVMKTINNGGWEGGRRFLETFDLRIK